MGPIFQKKSAQKQEAHENGLLFPYLFSTLQAMLILIGYLVLQKLKLVVVTFEAFDTTLSKPHIEFLETGIIELK